MKIDRIEVENFKIFEALKVDFKEGVNLFVGTNGTGKTSLLEAVNVAVGGFFGLQEQKMQRYIEFEEIRLANRLRAEQTTILAESKTIEAPWSRTIKRNTKSNDTAAIRPVGIYGKSIIDGFEQPDNRTIAPLISYYSTQRLFKDSSKSFKQKYDSAAGRRNGYLQCLEESAIKYILREWLGNAVTRRATKSIQEIESQDMILENVETAIKETLTSFLNLPKDFNLKIYQDPDFDNEVFVNYDNEHDLPLNYYSDGFRNLLYLFIDLVWRASQLNPWLTLEQIKNEVSGVVTIDEIDLHLHPKWQAKAIGLLQHFFPKVQFFITTHSPTVVGNFENGTLYLIDNNEIKQVEEKYFGKSINMVLRDILNANERHVPTQKKLDELMRLIDDGKQEEYSPLLEELKTLLGEDDLEIMKANTLIEWNNSSKA